MYGSALVSTIFDISPFEIVEEAFGPRWKQRLYVMVMNFFICGLNYLDFFFKLISSDLFLIGVSALSARSPRHSVCVGMQPTRSVFDFVVKFLQNFAPPCLLTYWFGGLLYPLEGGMVGSY